MTGSVTYYPETIPAFKGVPTIECLPPRVKISEVIPKLAFRPEYDPKVRNESPEDRGMMTQTILQLYQPCEKDIDIYTKVERCIRWGYADRNPLSPRFIRQQQHEYRADQQNAESISYTQSYPTASGFALLGISGLGKSTTLRRVLGRYPQVIRHECYNGIPFNETQITYIHMDTPNDGSLKGLCGAFFEKIDELLGTDYFTQYDEKRTTLNKMRINMARIARTYHLGIIVIDEIQALCVAKDESIPIKTLNFLVTLINTIGVPVILVGTPRALSFLQKEFQQAKRASGQGDALWERMPNDDTWRMFVTAMWKYQYTKTVVELTEEIINALYEEAVGIPFLAVNIYKLVQEYAIYSGEETFSAKSFHTIASRNMRLTLEMRRALLSGKEVNLRQYLDLEPFKMKDFQQAVQQDINPPEPPAPDPEVICKPDVREQAILTLMGLGLNRPIATKHVNRSLASFPGCTHSPILAQNAYADYLKSSSSREAVPVSSIQPRLGNNYAESLSAGFVGL